jgi:hypothetical protein
MGKGAKVSPGEMAAEELGGGNFLERGFESLGAWVGDGGCRSWVVTIVTLVVMMGACSGFSVLETENRPEKQWVPDGAIALDHNDYVKGTWPGNTRFNVSRARARSRPPSLARSLARSADAWR